MTEGPEIHRTAEKIRRALEGKVTNTNRSPLHRWSCDGYRCSHIGAHDYRINLSASCGF